MGIGNAIFLVSLLGWAVTAKNSQCICGFRFNHHQTQYSSFTSFKHVRVVSTNLTSSNFFHVDTQNDDSLRLSFNWEDVNYPRLRVYYPSLLPTFLGRWFSPVSMAPNGPILRVDPKGKRQRLFARAYVRVISWFLGGHVFQRSTWYVQKKIPKSSMCLLYPGILLGYLCYWLGCPPSQ